jgi:hypothetical protein
MQNYLYFNDRNECKIFQAINSYEARHYVINHYDLSYNASFVAISEIVATFFKKN